MNFGNRFNGFPLPTEKPLKRFTTLRHCHNTGLKPGVNEKEDIETLLASLLLQEPNGFFEDLVAAVD